MTVPLVTAVINSANAKQPANRASVSTAASAVIRRGAFPGDSKLARSLPSVAAAVINNGFAMDANIDPSSAIFEDDPRSPASEPYINAFVSRKQDKDNATYRLLSGPPIDLAHHGEKFTLESAPVTMHIPELEYREPPKAPPGCDPYRREI